MASLSLAYAHLHCLSPLPFSFWLLKAKVKEWASLLVVVADRALLPYHDSTTRNASEILTFVSETQVVFGTLL